MIRDCSGRAHALSNHRGVDSRVALMPFIALDRVFSKTFLHQLVTLDFVFSVSS